jgi:hypothetical protein
VTINLPKKVIGGAGIVLAAAGIIAAGIAIQGRSTAAHSGAAPTGATSAAPALATPGDGITQQFLDTVNGDGSGFHIEPAPVGANPAISQKDAEALAGEFPPTNGTTNGSILGECVTPAKGATPAKSYLCWLIDATSGKPTIVQTIEQGQPDEAIYGAFYVIVDAQPGSPTAGTIVTAVGADSKLVTPTP